MFQKPPFKPIRDMGLTLIHVSFLGFFLGLCSTWLVYELVALSCKYFFLVLLGDKVELRSSTSLLTKVVVAFHFNQDTALPSLPPA